MRANQQISLTSPTRVCLNYRFLGLIVAVIWILNLVVCSAHFLSAQRPSHNKEHPNLDPHSDDQIPLQLVLESQTQIKPSVNWSSDLWVEPTSTHFDQIDVVFPASSHRQEEEHNLKGRSDGIAQVSFEWRSRPSNKCTRDCGVGRKLKRFACFDLKYELHVEDKHCLSVGLIKPQELSDELCSEIDCPPEWSEIEFQECRGIGFQNPQESSNVKLNPAGRCRPVRYKRLQCSMIDRRGRTVYLEDYQCAQTLLGTESRSIETTPEPDETVNLDSLDQLEGGKESVEVKALEEEPYYDVSPWSDCEAKSCSEAGLRTRKLTCKLRRLGLIELVDTTSAACGALLKPRSEETCYQVCSSSDNRAQLEEEVSHETGLNRFVWRDNGWTRCSAECSGGQRKRLINCWDEHTDSPVSESLCEHETKPASEKETCNELPCQIDWQVAFESECSQTCGALGTKKRTIVCVQQNSTSGNRVVVSPHLCSSAKPETVEPCNRVDCPPNWNIGFWSECSRQCGVGVRNRTVSCVQLYATQFSKPVENQGDESTGTERTDWYPGKLSNVPLVLCHEYYKSMPITLETCANYCPDGVYIEADPLQNFQDSSLKRNVNINLGGHAEIIGGKNLKIRCRIISSYKTPPEEVEWWKDGVKLFHTHSSEDSNSILNPGESVISAGSSLFSDQAPRLRRRRFRGHYQDSADKAISTLLDDPFNIAYVSDERYSKLRSNTLRIKKIRPSDSGLFTCSYKMARESVYLTVK